MTGGLADRTAIVTGSSSGIGEGIARRFADEGANVVVNSRSQERAEATAAEIREEGGTAVGIAADVTDQQDVRALVDATVEEFGSLDVMVNNAGTNIRGPAEEFAPEDWQRVLDVNLTGVFYGAQAAGRRMIEQGSGGQIVNISSVMGEVGLHRRVAYCASKAGVNNLTRTLAVEWAEHDVHVNALAPGYVRTEMADEAAESVGFTDDDVRARTPLGRYGSVEEMATCVAFLASGDHFVTGEVLHADGGWLAYAWGCRDD